MKQRNSVLTLKYIGINTYKEPVIYIHENSHIYKSEGFAAQARVCLCLNDKSIIATLNTIKTDFLRVNQAGLSEYAWNLLGAKEGDVISISHPKPLDSL